MAEDMELEGQKAYLAEKFNTLMDQIGDGYGTPLMDELVRRLEQTVAEFHEEVSELLVDLKKRSQERRKKLDQLMSGSEAATPEPETAPEEEMSELERRLEEHEKEEPPPAETPEPSQKKGVFGRKKK